MMFHYVSFKADCTVVDVFKFQNKKKYKIQNQLWQVRFLHQQVVMSMSVKWEINNGRCTYSESAMAETTTKCFGSPLCIPG